MDTELKALKPNSKNYQRQQHQITDEGNRPLLKSDSPSSDDDRHNPNLPHPSKPITAAELQEMEKKFAAYVRRDVYGSMGLGEIPVTEKLLLVLAMFTLVPFRVIVGMAILVLYYLICNVCTLFSTPNRSEEIDAGQHHQEDYAHLGGWRRHVIVMTGRFLSRALLFTLGFYWIRDSDQILQGEEHSESIRDQTQRTDEVEPERPGAVVSNHVSYVDILYHMSSSFPSFVAKRSVGKLPLVGLIRFVFFSLGKWWVLYGSIYIFVFLVFKYRHALIRYSLLDSKCLGCVYVQREDKSSDFKGVSGVVTERIKEASGNKIAPMMLIFPEGTTTNGGFLLPFKTGAFIAGAPVHPVILKYPYHRFSVAWDSISGVRHVVLLLCQFVNHLEVTKLPVYYSSKEEKDDPKLYASNTRRLMANEGNLILSDIGLPEKRIYHAALNGNNSLHRKFRQKTD